ncbi:MAG: hypothetical protein WCO86_05980, partial [Planctomycetota bacterium]
SPTSDGEFMVWPVLINKFQNERTQLSSPTRFATTTQANFQPRKSDSEQAKPATCRFTVAQDSRLSYLELLSLSSDTPKHGCLPRYGSCIRHHEPG